MSECCQKSQPHELFNGQPSFSNDGAHCPRADRLAAMVRYWNNSPIGIAHPDFMRSFATAIQPEAQFVQTAGDFLV